MAALLDLDSVIERRIRGGEDSPDLDNARSTFRALIARLGEAAAAGGVDPRESVAPFVEALLAVACHALATARLGHRRPGPRSARRQPASRSATARMTPAGLWRGRRRADPSKHRAPPAVGARIRHALPARVTLPPARR